MVKSPSYHRGKKGSFVCVGVERSLRDVCRFATSVSPRRLSLRN